MEVVNNLELNDKQKEIDNFFIVSLFFMSILLHQSNVIFGVNVSLADLFCFIIFVLLIGGNKFYFPTIPLLFFMAVSILVLAVSAFYVPIKFFYFPESLRIINDYAKLLAILLYFLIGYNLAALQKMESAIKWYSIFGLSIGLLGIVFTILKIDLFSSILFYANTRFRGLMNDPNYFSLLQITSLVYFSRLEKIPFLYQVLAYLITITSVVVSGSKTGIIALTCYLTYRLVEYLLFSMKKVRIIIIQLFIIFIFLLLIPITTGLLQNFISDIAYHVPAFARIQHLYTDFDAAISQNGSERGMTWNGAFQIIQHSPLIGIGIGTYINIASEMFHSTDIAHNTYLQLAAEWGIPLAFILISFMVHSLIMTTSPRNNGGVMIKVYRDILIILLVGSIAISLNNSRVLWIVFGALFFSIYNPQSLPVQFKKWIKS